MVEIGVESANVSERLLAEHPGLRWFGVDPYENNNSTYENVVAKLARFPHAKLFRAYSLEALSEIADATIDLVFLDARHDFQNVIADCWSWMTKVREGGMLSGHDFQWQYPGLS